MSSVSTEGKLEWYLGGEYALRTIGAYLQLGFSLGAVQARHACVPYKLAAYTAKCALRRHVWRLPDDDVPVGLEEENAVRGRAVRADDAAVDPAAFLAELLAKFDAIAAITHAEAVDVRLLRRLMHQDMLVREQRRAQASHGHADAVGGGAAKAHASEENVVFQLAESDTTYAAVVAAGHPVAITYRDFVVLTTLLSEAIAWDLLWIHEGQDRQRAYHAAKSAAAAARGSEDLRVAPQPASEAPCTTETDCVALMLPNSVEYNALWMAAARSGPLHTFLDVLYRNSNSEQQPKAERGTYRPCRTALLNTNLASNAMLYHAIECSGSVMLVLDAAYVPLLFRTREEPNGTEAEGKTGAASCAEAAAALELHVPPTVKRVYLWRSTNAAGQPLSAAMTDDMASQLRAFNAVGYGEAGAWGSHTTATPAADAQAVAVRPPTPALDLYAVVRPFYTRAQATPSCTVASMQHTYLVCSPSARFLVHAVLARPPAAWATLLSLRQPGTASASGGAAARHGGATAAQSETGRQQLRQYTAKLASILARLLRRFHHTQPILFIYTSGTTGLPKAARFSHLRFFATGFLSRVLYYRDKIAETVVQQMDEVAYVAAHPGPLAVPDAAASSTEEGKKGQEDGVERGACCPRAPHIFGIDSLDRTRRQRNTVEATVVALFHVCLWWLRFLASLLGLEYYLAAFVERWRYTPAQMAAIEGERRLVTLYNCLPMYHTVGSVFCLGHLLHALEEQQHAWAQVRRCAPRAARLAATVPTVRMVLRSKFSASQFRKDLQRYHVTVVQYIGEVLRYAVLFERSHPPVHAIDEAGKQATAGSPVSTATSVCSSAGRTEAELEALTALNRTTWRVPYAFGNGLRQDIWVECMRRLNIAHPVEFYSSTEGNIFLLNLYGMPGIVGHIPRFPWPIQWLSMQYFPIFPFRVLKFDEAAQRVYRDPATGYCAHCAVGEVGEVVGEVIEGFDMFALRRFDGYHKAASRAAAVTSTTAGAAAGDHEEDRAARESKVIRRVLWPYRNDCYFLSGDLIRMDRHGFCTFVDRVGDTFRWKGENVSTLEVSNAINSIHAAQVGVREAVVYGVQLPGREGRAGMAMLSLQPLHSTSTTSTTAAATPEESGAGGDGKVCEAGSASPGPSASSSSTALASLHRSGLTLAEERRFLQDELFNFLNGTTRLNGDGTASQAGLPAYAVPVLVRMQDRADDDDEGADDDAGRGTAAADGVTDSGSSCTGAGAAAGGRQPANKHAVSEDAAQTSTFKYKKGTLMKQGYEFDGSSAVCADIPAGAWGRGTVSETSSDKEEKESAVTTPYTRVYVLVTNPAAFKQLALPSASAAAAAGARPAGYVPLTPAARAVLGEQLDKCGW